VCHYERQVKLAKLHLEAVVEDFQLTLDQAKTNKYKEDKSINMSSLKNKILKRC